MGAWFPKNWTDLTYERRVRSLRIEAGVIIHLLLLLKDVTLVWPNGKTHLKIEGLPTDARVVGVRQGEGLHQVEILLESEEFGEVGDVTYLYPVELRVISISERVP